MLINKSIREAVADLVRTAQPLFLLVNDSFPAGFDASRELPAAAVWFEDGSPDDAYVDTDTQATELQIGIYVKTDNTDADLDVLAEPVRLAMHSADGLLADFTYAGFAYDRDPDSSWRVLRLIYNCQYTLEDA